MPVMESIFEYGIVGAFETLAQMRGEDDAILHKRIDQLINDQEVDDYSKGSEESLATSSQLSTTYNELYFNSIQLGTVLHHRYGLRAGNNVLLICKGATEAEVISILACARIGTPFIPIDISWLKDNSRVGPIIEETDPFLAIVVADSDDDFCLHKLASFGLYRYCLIKEDGSFQANQLSFMDVSEELPLMPPLSVEAKKLYYPLLNNTNEFAANNMGLSYPLYIYYTSGSTGRPKGVIGTHEGFVNRLAFQFKHFPYDFDEVCLRRTPLIFIDSLVEIFAPLLSGIPIYSPPTDGDLITWIKDSSSMQISRMTILPSQLAMIFDILPELNEIWPDLKVVNVSGEACSTALVRRFRLMLPSCTLVNYYGSTELAGDVTYSIVYSPENNVQLNDNDDNDNDTNFREVRNPQTNLLAPIGIAIENNYVFIVEEILGNDVHSNNESDRPIFQLVRDGVKGELLVLGRHVALGYYKNSDDTAQRFLVNPVIFDQSSHLINYQNFPIDSTESFISRNSSRDEEENVESSNTTKSLPYVQQHSIVFRTGDLVVRDSVKGQFIWVGRKDLQVKVRGIRMEIEEFELRICEALSLQLNEVCVLITGSNNSVVLAVIKDSVSTSFTPEISSATELSMSIKLQLSAILPQHYVPDYIQLMKEFPRTTSGKLNRKALANIISVTSTNEHKRKVHDLHFSSSTNDWLPKTSRTEAHTDEVIKETILEILCAILPSIFLKPDVLSDWIKYDFLTLGGNSMNAIEFLWKLKTKFDVQLVIEDIMTKSLQRLVSLILELSSCSSRYQSNWESPSLAGNSVLTHSLESRPNSKISPHAVALGNNRLVCNHHWRFSTYESIHSCSPAGPIEIFASNNIYVSRLWNYKLLKCVDSSPLALEYKHCDDCSHGKPNSSYIYIGSHGGDFVCLDSTDGSVLWCLQLGMRVEASATYLHSNRIMGRDDCLDYLLIPSYSANDVDGNMDKKRMDGKVGTLWCVRAHDGLVMWDVGLEGELKSSVIVSHQNEIAFIGCYDSKLYMIHYSTGQIAKYFNLDGPIYSTPSFTSSSNLLLCATISGTLYDVNISGTLSTITRRYCTGIDGSPIYSSLLKLNEADAGVENLCYAIGAIDGTMSVINHSDNSLVHKFEARKPIFSSPCLMTKRIDGLRVTIILFGSHDGILRARALSLSRKPTGQTEELDLNWDVDLRAVIFSSPIVASVKNQRNNCTEVVIIACTTAGIVYVITDSGKIATSTQLPAEIFSTPIVVNGVIYVGCRDDRIHAIKINLE